MSRLNCCISRKTGAGGEGKERICLAFWFGRFWSRRLISIFARFAFAGLKSLVRYSAKNGFARHFWAITIKAKKGGKEERRLALPYTWGIWSWDEPRTEERRYPDRSYLAFGAGLGQKRGVASLVTITAYSLF
jgi:hypothetical protein